MIFQNPYDRKLQSLGALGFMEYLAAASKLMGGDSGDIGTGGGAGMPPSNQVTVSPNINVNPQISPIFQQQFQPTNSPISAGTSQGTPQAGGAPMGAGAGGGVSTPLTPPVPAIPIDWNKYLLWGGIGIAALVAIKMLSGKSRTTARPRRRRVTRTIKRK